MDIRRRIREVYNLLLKLKVYFFVDKITFTYDRELLVIISLQGYRSVKQSEFASLRRVVAVLMEVVHPNIRLERMVAILMEVVYPNHRLGLAVDRNKEVFNSWEQLLKIIV